MLDKVKAHVSLTDIATGELHCCEGSETSGLVSNALLVNCLTPLQLPLTDRLNKMLLFRG